jgi:hypothetical protein
MQQVGIFFPLLKGIEDKLSGKLARSSSSSDAGIFANFS